MRMYLRVTLRWPEEASITLEARSAQDLEKGPITNSKEDIIERRDMLTTPSLHR